MPTPKEGYFLRDGTKVPGTTTICSAYKDSGGLIHWAWDQGRSGIKEPNLSMVAAAVWEAVTQGGGVEMIKILLQEGMKGLDYRETRDKAGSVGTDIHAEIEARLKDDGQLPWPGLTHIRVVEQEIHLISESLRYGGTPDAIGIDNQGRYVLLDWKTSKGVYTNFQLQLAAYKHLWDETCPPGRKITGGVYLVHFSKTGEFIQALPYDVPELPDSPSLKKSWRQFKDARRMYGREPKLKEALERAKSCMKPL